jgi:hypothetical protein
MIILFDAGRPVKAARRPFGAGLLVPSGRDNPADDPPPPAGPAGRPAPFDPSPADRAWWAVESHRIEAARIDDHFDRLAAESAALDRLEVGLCF